MGYTHQDGKRIPVSRGGKGGSNPQKSQNEPRGSSNFKRNQNIILFIGKLAIWGVIILAFYLIIYSIFGEFFSYLSWLFDIDPMLLILSMVLCSVAFAAILTSKMGMRGRSSRGK